MGDAFVQISGYLNILSGVLLVVYWYAFAIFLPYAQLSSTLALLVENRNWTWINALGVLGALSGLLGQAGIYVDQISVSNLYSSLGFYIAVAGTTLLIGTMLWETVLWPILVRHDRSLLDFQGPLYTSKTFFPFFIFAGFIYSAGYVLVGIGIIQSGILPSVAGYLLAIGAPAFSFGSLFGKLQVYPRTIGVTMVSIAVIWLGLSLLGL